MTLAEEIAAIEATWLSWVTAGCPSSYTLSTPHGSRNVTRNDMMAIRKHLDELKLRQAREERGPFYVAQFREQD